MAGSDAREVRAHKDRETTMAGSVNKVILVGNLGADPEVRTLPSGSKVVNLSVATSESWRDKNSGERKEKTEWHRVVIFSEGLARVAEQYLQQGRKVYIEGQLQTRKWQDQSGAGQVLDRSRAPGLQLDPDDARRPQQDGDSPSGFSGPRSEGGFSAPAERRRPPAAPPAPAPRRSRAASTTTSRSEPNAASARPLSRSAGEGVSRSETGEGRRRAGLLLQRRLTRHTCRRCP